MLVACCLLDKRASSPHCPNNGINRQKYYLLHLGDLNPNLQIKGAWEREKKELEKEYERLFAINR